MTLLGVRRAAAAEHVAHAGGVASNDQLAPLDVALLTATATAVLPSELGADGVATVTRGFVSWLRGYRPSAELLHGYGTSEIAYAGASPAATWRDQLRALDRLSREKTGRGLVAATAEQRRAVIRIALADVKVNAFPDPQDARHVVLALLAWYYGSPAATDLCYGVEIMRNQCRPLRQNPDEPAPLRRKRPDGSPRRLRGGPDA